MSPTLVASGGNLCRKCKRPRGRMGGEARRGERAPGSRERAVLSRSAPRGPSGGGVRRGCAVQGRRECCRFGVRAGFRLLSGLFRPATPKEKKQGVSGRGGSVEGGSGAGARRSRLT